MAVGRLVRWIDNRGFGFIRIDREDPDYDEGRDVFVHLTDFHRSGIHGYDIRPGQRLRFETVLDRRPNGLRAVSLEIEPERFATNQIVRGAGLVVDQVDQLMSDRDNRERHRPCSGERPASSDFGPSLE